MIRVYKTKYCPAWKRYFIIFAALFIICFILMTEVLALVYLKDRYYFVKRFEMFFLLIIFSSSFIMPKMLIYKIKKRLKNDTSAWVLYNERIFFIHCIGITYLYKKYIPIKNYIIKIIHNTEAIEGMITGSNPDKRFCVKEIIEIKAIKHKYFYSRIYFEKNIYTDINKNIAGYDEILNILKEMIKIRR